MYYYKGWYDPYPYNQSHPFTAVYAQILKIFMDILKVYKQRLHGNFIVALLYCGVHMHLMQSVSQKLIKRLLLCGAPLFLGCYNCTCPEINILSVMIITFSN